MNAATFLKQFEHLAEAPNGIAKLRELILQLAVRGKLVPQDPNDEPASELLERIEVEKKRLLAERMIRRSKSIPPIEPEDAPYEVPDSWRWSRIRHVTHDCGQTVPEAEFSYIDVGSIDGAIGKISDSPSVVAPEDAPSRARKLVKLGTVIYSTVRPYLLNTAVVDSAFTPSPIVSTAFAVLHPFNGLEPRYLLHYLRSGPFTEYVNEAMTGMAYPAINDAKMSVGPVPIPPLAEQKRIVAKVDELMALCDNLEAKRQARRTKQIALNRASLHALTEPNGTSLAAAWHRVRDHFDHLYTVPETVADLRQTILQLAVMGRLIPQDPNDEPASELLKKIQAARQCLIAEGRARRHKTLAPIEPGEVLQELPPQWLWVRVGECALIRGGKRIPKGMSFSSQPTDHVYIRVTDMQGGSISDSDLRYVSEDVFKHISNYTIDQNDLYITIAGSIGRVGTVPSRFHGMNLTENAAKLTFGVMDREFLCLALSSPVVQEQFSGRVRQMAQPKLALKRIADSIFPLPPLAEQKRIVAKVDQLMAVCDDLEAKLQQTQTDADNLLTAIVHELTSPGKEGG